MTTTKIAYWIITAIVGLMMMFSGYSYLTKDAMAAAFTHLGYPSYFRVELAIMKIIGVVLLLVKVPPRLREWTYAGFAFTFVSAFIAHTASGDAVNYRVMPLLFLVLLAVSYFLYHRLLRQPQGLKPVSAH